MRLRSRLPDYSLPGMLRGCEADIRQETNLLLLGKYLRGNPQLLEATRNEDWFEIGNQLERSISAALNVVIWRMRHALVQEAERRREFAAEAYWMRGMQNGEPFAGRSIWIFPIAIQIEIALGMLNSAVNTKRLSPSAAAIVAMMLEERMTQSEVARRLQISRSAVHQRLQPVCAYLRKTVEEAVEKFPHDL